MEKFHPLCVTSSLSSAGVFVSCQDDRDIDDDVLEDAQSTVVPCGVGGLPSTRVCESTRRLTTHVQSACGWVDEEGGGRGTKHYKSAGLAAAS